MQLSFYLGVPYKDAVASYAKITSLMTVSYLKSLLGYPYSHTECWESTSSKGHSCPLVVQSLAKVRILLGK